MLWIIIGSFLAVILVGAYAADRKRKKMRYPEEVRRETIHNARHTAEKEAESHTWTWKDRP